MYHKYTMKILRDVESKNNDKLVEAMCLCGNIGIYKEREIKNKYIKSCGCINWKSQLYKHKLYTVWINMKQRCYNPNDKSYKNYGARGIKMYYLWKDDYVHFFRFCIFNGWEYGLQIDRINNNGNYTPLNCRFVTGQVNCCNKRLSPKNKTGYIGIAKTDNNKYTARIKVNGKINHIGTFETKRSAVEARNNFIRLNDKNEAFKIQPYRHKI